MEQIVIGYDDNLGLPSDFRLAIGCDIISYHNLAEMIKDFNEQKLLGIFIPSGTLPYLDNYEIISQATFGSNHKLTLQTNFVSTKNLSLLNIKTSTIGRVNKYCTTSFWAPLIYLMDFIPKHTLLKFEDTNGFQDLLFKTAEGQIDCSMVWDIILQENPDAANKVHQLFNKNDLPTPVLIGRPGFPSNIKEKINHFKTTDIKAFFNGFQPADIRGINQFQQAIQKSIQYFNIPMK